MIQTYTFFQLITEYIVEIPIIQRDYAQGRELPNVTYIRDRFVKALVGHIISGKTLPLGFVYGKIEGKDKLRNMLLHKQAVEKLLSTVEQYAHQFQINVNASVEADELIEQNNMRRFIPLDGQQRLTTLFLLFWYIEMRKKNQSAAWLANFKYNNRKSALAFFEELAKLGNIKVINKHLQGDLKDQIQNYTWFLSKWNYDATVSGALVMLQRIHEEFGGYPELNFDHLDVEDLGFTFHFLDLDELQQADELYIKMNERGKQLSDFEHFKAWLQDYTNKRYQEIGQKAFLKNFWKKLDTEWLDFFWQNMDIDFTGLDDLFYNYLKTMAINFHLATDSAKDMPDHLKTLLQDIRNEIVYKKTTVKYIPISRCIQQIKNADGSERLFELFSFDCLKFVDRCFETTISLRSRQVFKDEIDKVLLKPFVSRSLIKAYISVDSFTLNLWDHAMYFALLRLISSFSSLEQIDVAHFRDWMRILRNLVYNTYIQNPENVYSALHSIDELITNYFSSTEFLSKVLMREDFELKFFNQFQLREEKQKVALSSDPAWLLLIEKFENHNYFYGQIGFMLTMVENEQHKYDRMAFESISSVAAFLFLEDTENLLLQRALLSIGNYLVASGSNLTFCRTDTDGLRNRNENWRRVFNDGKRNKLLLQLIKSLIELQESEPDTLKALKLVIKSHKYTPNDWAYYFMEYAYPIKQAGLLEIRLYSDEDIRLLPAKTVVGYHLELRTVYLKIFISKSLIELKPFTSPQLMQEKTTEGHPGIFFSGFSFEDRNYRLDIRYTFKNKEYIFYFYHHAESLKARVMSEQIAQALHSYNLDETSRSVYKIVMFEDVMHELLALVASVKSLQA